MHILYYFLGADNPLVVIIVFLILLYDILHYLTIDYKAYKCMQLTWSGMLMMF